jgi:hypothetical protein
MKMKCPLNVPGCRVKNISKSQYGMAWWLILIALVPVHMHLQYAPPYELNYSVLIKCMIYIWQLSVIKVT